MELYEVDPFIRYAQIQPALLNGKTFRMAYDCRLFYVLKGSGTLVLETEKIALAPADIIFIPPVTPYRVLGNIRVVALNFDLTHHSFSRKTPIDPPPVEEFNPKLIFETDRPAALKEPFILHDGGFLDDRFLTLVTQFRFVSELSEMQTSAILKDVLSELITQRTTERTPGLISVSEAIGFIQRNYQHPIKNTDIAQAVGYNPLYLNRLFKQYTGITMHHYLNRERIKMAAHILHNTTLSVEIISEECGYGSRAHFCTCFRRLTGMTPLAFRRSGIPPLQILQSTQAEAYPVQ